MIKGQSSFVGALPLFDFFQSLRDWEKNELQRPSLTMDEYEIALNALDKCPFELNQKEHYYTLCKLLWFKPYHADPNDPLSDKKFREKFDFFWTQLEDYNKASEIETDTNTAKEEKKPIDNSPQSRSISNQQDTNNSSSDSEAADVTEKTAAQKRAAANPLTDYWVSFYEENNISLAEKTLAVQETRRFSFLDKTKLLPLDIRRMYQLLLTARKVSKDGEKVDIDIDATISKLSKQGYVSEFSQRRKPRLWMNIHFLIDYGGSMVAFHHFSDVVSNFIQSIGGNKSHIWYFRNYPELAIFQDKNHLEPYYLNDWIPKIDTELPVQILIFSDAGAARGFKSEERIERTIAFLDKIKNHRVVWLNPMERNRWQGTSAESIEKKVKMYDTTDGNFVAAMKTLSKKSEM